MAYYREFDPVSRFVRFRFEGHLTDEVLVEFYQEGRSVMASTNAVSGILDFTEVTSVGGSAETIRKLADLPPIIDDPTPRAVVAVGDCIYGLMRMYHIIGEQTRQELYVIRTLEDAYAMFDIKSPNFKVLSAA